MLELIDLKGKSALDKALEIARDLEPIEPQKAASLRGSTKAKTSSQPKIQAEGHRSAHADKSISSQLQLEEFVETVDLLQAYGVEFQIDFEIVRPDYYSGTVFEIYAEPGSTTPDLRRGTYELASFLEEKVSSTGSQDLTDYGDRPNKGGEKAPCSSIP